MLMFYFTLFYWNLFVTYCRFTWSLNSESVPNVQLSLLALSTILGWCDVTLTPVAPQPELPWQLSQLFVVLQPPLFFRRALPLLSSISVSILSLLTNTNPGSCTQTGQQGCNHSQQVRKEMNQQAFTLCFVIKSVKRCSHSFIMLLNFIFHVLLLENILKLRSAAS